MSNTDISNTQHTAVLQLLTHDLRSRSQASRHFTMQNSCRWKKIQNWATSKQQKTLRNGPPCARS